MLSSGAYVSLVWAVKWNSWNIKSNPSDQNPEKINPLYIHCIPTQGKEMNKEKIIRNGTAQCHARAECLSMSFDTMCVVTTYIFPEHLYQSSTYGWIDLQRGLPKLNSLCHEQYGLNFVQNEAFVNLLLVRTCCCQVPSEKPILTTRKPTAKWNISLCFAYLFVLTRPLRSLKSINSVSCMLLKGLYCSQSSLLSPHLGPSSPSPFFSLTSSEAQPDIW